MPIRPNLVERTILLTLNQGPGPMLDFLGALAFKAVCVALKLDIFEVLKGGTLSAAEVASQIKADERGTTLLLHALESIGYVERQGDRYTNTPMTVKWMLRGSPNNIGSGFPHIEDLLEHWGDLDKAVRQGKPPLLAWEWFDRQPNGWEHYNAMMMATARMADEEIMTKVKLPPAARRLIDVGGGHGLHAINFCHRYPALSATVLDWSQAQKVAEANIADEGMKDRVTFQEGDFWKVELGAGYDVALMYNIIHMYLPEKNMELVRKLASALNKGALLIILDQMVVKASGPMAKATGALIGLNLFNEVNGQTYPHHEVVGWLTKSGFIDTRWTPLRKTPGFAIVAGRKAG